jgi:hypothetical protein
MSQNMGGAMTSHILTIPHWIPVSTNKLLKAHWAARNKLKKKDANIIWGRALEDRIPTALQRRKVEIHFILKPQRGRPIDPDNCLKSLLDALVKCRMIIDDSQKWCWWVGPTIERGTKDFWGTRLILTDLEDI